MGSALSAKSDRGSHVRGANSDAADIVRLPPQHLGQCPYSRRVDPVVICHQYPRQARTLPHGVVCGEASAAGPSSLTGHGRPASHPCKPEFEGPLRGGDER